MPRCARNEKYGFYLNKFLNEYSRMKKLNNTNYRDKIQRCNKTLNSITSELCECVENLLSSMDMYSPKENWEAPTGKVKSINLRQKMKRKKRKKIKDNKEKKEEKDGGKNEKIIMKMK